MTTRRALLRQEAKSLIKLAVPITLVAALDLVPSVVVGMMMGKASGASSQKVIAASGLAFFFQDFAFQNVTSGVGAAVASLCSHAYGAQQYKQLWFYVQAGLVAAIYLFIPIALIGVNGSGLLKLLGQDPELARIAGYLILNGLAALPGSMMYTVARSALQAQNIALPLVFVSVISHAISLPVGYVLGFYTPLGYMGIALSSVIGSIVRVLAIIPFILKNELFREAWPGWQWRQANTLVHKLWSIGVGCVFMMTFQSAGFVITTLLCGYLPNPAISIAASTVGSSFLMLPFIPMIGISIAGVVRVGNAIGAGNADRASCGSQAMLISMFSISLLAVAIGEVFAKGYVRGYTSDAATIELATRVVRHLLPLAPLGACVMAGQSIFQACNAQALNAALNCVFMIIIGVSASALFSFHGNGGVFGLWNGQIVGSVCMLIATIVWWRRLSWQREIEKAKAHGKYHDEHEQWTGRAHSLDSMASDADSIVFMRHRHSSVSEA